MTCLCTLKHAVCPCAPSNSPPPFLPALAPCSSQPDGTQAKPGSGGATSAATDASGTEDEAEQQATSALKPGTRLARCDSMEDAPAPGTGAASDAEPTLLASQSQGGEEEEAAERWVAGG